MSLWSGKPFVAVRVFATDGQYPEYSVRTSKHRYETTRDFVWCAVVQDPLPSEWEVGEFPTLAPEEIRLLAAIALSESNPWENGLPIIAQGASEHLRLELGAEGLLDPEVDKRVRDVVDELERAQAQRRPPLGERLTVRQLGEQADALELLRCIDSSDQLLLAGLARYLGASRILLLAGEPEEGAILLFISMGAALEYIRSHIAHEKGVDKVAYVEVSNYLRHTFKHGDEMAEYFEERYDERVIAFHPANKSGEFWSPPLMMGDVYHLQKSLIGMYRHIVLGEINDD